jgi:hypothetical protein
MPLASSIVSSTLPLSRKYIDVPLSPARYTNSPGGTLAGCWCREGRGGGYLERGEAHNDVAEEVVFDVFKERDFSYEASIDAHDDLRGGGCQAYAARARQKRVPFISPHNRKRPPANASPPPPTTYFQFLFTDSMKISKQNNKKKYSMP